MTSIDDMVLIPRPRSIERLGGGRTRATVDVASNTHPSVHPQGFWLTIDGDGIRIEHRDAAGLHYARQLLDQIRAQCPDGDLPAVRIEDHPDFPVRGLMLDISRDRVPTKATLTRLVELAGLARINQLQLYTEHTYAYRDHRDVWRNASPMTAAHVEWLEDECREHGIELVANQNCFGHMERWLALPAYQARAECPDGWDLLGAHRSPSVLAPTEDNAAFTTALLRELLAGFHSRSVNIGCDEPFELGRGVSQAQVEARGLGRVYLDHVRRIAQPLLDEGRQVQIWADVLRRHPDLGRELPEGIVPIAWCYEAPTPDGGPYPLPDVVQTVLEQIGTDVDAFSGFARNVAPLAEADIPFWVAPGTSSWNSFVGRIDNALGNLADAAEVGRAHGSRGYLIADWGDNGHLQPPSVSFGPILYGGAVSWCLDSNRDLDLTEALSTHVFGDSTGGVADALDLLGRQWARTGRRALNASPLHAAVFPDQIHMVLDAPDPEAVGDVLGRIEDACALLAGAEPTCADGDHVVQELGVAARLARHGAWRLLGPDGPGEDALGDDMADILEGQLVAWLARARPGGLSDSIANLDAGFATSVPVPDHDLH